MGAPDFWQALLGLSCTPPMRHAASTNMDRNPASKKVHVPAGGNRYGSTEPTTTVSPAEPAAKPGSPASASAPAKERRDANGNTESTGTTDAQDPSNQVAAERETVDQWWSCGMPIDLWWKQLTSRRL